MNGYEWNEAYHIVLYSRNFTGISLAHQPTVYQSHPTIFNNIHMSTKTRGPTLSPTNFIHFLVMSCLVKSCKLDIYIYLYMFQWSSGFARACKSHEQPALSLWPLLSARPSCPPHLRKRIQNSLNVTMMVCDCSYTSTIINSFRQNSMVFT